MKRCILIDIIPPEKSREEALQDIEELRRLVETYGGIVIVEILQKRGRPSSKTFLGSGKALEAAELAKKHRLDMVIFNHFLKPHQSSHLSKLFSHDADDITGRSNIPIWDRTDIILKIFEKHATSEVAKMQIKLAQLKHQIPKIYQYQTKLFDRERGGISGTRGAGEKGIEQEKRHIREQIKQIEKKLESIRIAHANQRQHRSRAGLKTVALVGYTNAGKSTLLKALTKKKVSIADELFVTLDTSIGSLWIEDPENPGRGQKVLIADTIGFIQNLPPHLIESFKATLMEVAEADLILHVIDGSDRQQLKKMRVVEEILAEIAAPQQRIIRVFNKSDQKKVSYFYHKGTIQISAIDRTTLQELKRLVRKEIIGTEKTYRLY